MTLLCHSWDGSALPETQAKLYAGYVKKFYTWNQNLQELRDHAKRCGTKITILKKQLHDQLGELAKAALDTPQEGFRLSQSLVEQYLGEEDDEESLCYLALRLGWLNRTGRDNRGHIFAFYHATFQEYFAACSIKNHSFFFEHVIPRHWKGFMERSYRIFQYQWEQVFLIWIGGDIAKNQKNKVLDNLITFQDECGGFYSARAFCIAAKALAEYREYNKADLIIESLIQLSTGSNVEFHNMNLHTHFAWGFNSPYSDYEVIEQRFWFTTIDLAREILLRTDRKRLLDILNIKLGWVITLLSISQSNNEFEIKSNILCTRVFNVEAWMLKK